MKGYWVALYKKIDNAKNLKDYSAKVTPIIKNNKTIYDMFGDKKSKKYGDDKRRKLEKYDLKKLPKFIQYNEVKLKEWLD